MKRKCLYCYKDILNDYSDFHETCSKNFFGSKYQPEIPYKLDDMNELALNVIKSQVTITGVQKKISLGLEKDKISKQERFTIVGLWGGYILKPPASEYPFMPENESLTMKLANLFGIKTVPHSLIKLKSGELAYITKRIDRKNSKKLPMEDMAQLTNRLTEYKYNGSLEQVGKAIKSFSNNQGLDLINFFEVVMFSFITGNADMHLKNFSIIHKNNIYGLSPAYDLLSTRLLIPEEVDNEESALTMNGKKRKFIKEDFNAFANSLQVNDKVLNNIYKKFKKKYFDAKSLIQISFLPESMQNQYINLIESRLSRLEII